MSIANLGDDPFNTGIVNITDGFEDDGRIDFDQGWSNFLQTTGVSGKVIFNNMPAIVAGASITLTFSNEAINSNSIVIIKNTSQIGGVPPNEFHPEYLSLTTTDPGNGAVEILIGNPTADNLALGFILSFDFIIF